METRDSKPVPLEPTVEQVRLFATIHDIRIGVSSDKTLEGKGPQGSKWRVEVKFVDVKKESEMTPELVMAGPTRRGEVNCYVAIDGNRYYFSAKTGEALGGEMRPILSKKAADQFSKV